MRMMLPTPCAFRAGRVHGAGLLLLLLLGGLPSGWDFPGGVDAFASMGRHQRSRRNWARHSSSSSNSGSSSSNSSSSSSSNSNEAGTGRQEEPEPEPIERQPRRVIDITNEFRETVQSLPVSFIAAWPTWILDHQGALTKIPDEKDGYVNPTSIDEVWHPVDLLRPTILSCALGFHIRDGTIRHVFPAVDVGYPPHLNETTNTNNNRSINPYYRNRGLCSVPRAYQWIEFHSLLPEEYDQYRVEASVIGKSKSKIEEDDAEKEEDEHVLLSSRGGHGGETTSGRRNIGGIANAIQRMSICLAEQDSTEEFGTPGSQIVHVLLPNHDDEEDGMILPKADAELHVTLQRETTMEEKEEKEYAVEEKQPGGRLQVRVVTTMAGSDSDYLPAVYRPLFHDEPTLRNPVYAQYQHNKRQREKNGK